MQINHHQVWEMYTSAWKSENIDDRRAVLTATLGPECTYRDPQIKVSGYDELIAYMTNFHLQVPGGHFITRRFRFLQGQSVAQWDMLDRQGNVIGDGVSVGHYNADGRLVAIAGFFDT